MKQKWVYTQDEWDANKEAYDKKRKSLNWITYEHNYETNTYTIVYIEEDNEENKNS